MRVLSPGRDATALLQSWDRDRPSLPVRARSDRLSQGAGCSFELFDPEMRFAFSGRRGMREPKESLEET